MEKKPAIHLFELRQWLCTRQAPIKSKYQNNLSFLGVASKISLKNSKTLDWYDDLKRSGRPKKIPERGIRHLKRLVKEKARLCTAEITSDLNSSLSTSVSTVTVRRYLQKLAFEYVVKVKKQWLSSKHRQQRVAWCMQYSSCTCNDWQRVIFSDESTFYVLRCKIWRLDKEKLLPGCLELINTGDGGKIGIWGGIFGFDTTSARIFIENMDDTMYCKILKNELKQSMASLPEKTSIVFQHDLAPWHISDTVRHKIDKMKLNVLDWPSKSSDLNPIKMLWSILDEKLASRPIYSKSALINRLQEEWNSIDQELYIKLVDSMPERIRKCLRAKGGHFL